MYLGIPDCTSLYKSVLECTRVYQSAPECTRVYKSVPEFTSGHNLANFEAITSEFCMVIDINNTFMQNLRLMRTLLRNSVLYFLNF